MSDARDLEARASAVRHPAQLWIASTYFAEGYPYSIVNNLAEVVFASLGASLSAVGLTSLFHLPWNLKFLWAPLVDAYGTKRRWLLGIELALVVTLVAAAFSTSSAASVPALSMAFLALALLSATHDVAIDGFYLTALDEAEQSRFVGLRQLTYKLANLLVRGPAIVLAGVVGWRLGMLALAALMGAIALAHVVLLPRDEVEKRSFGELTRWLLRPRALGVGLTLGLIAFGLRASLPRLGKTPLGRIPMEAYLALALGVSLVWLRSRRENSTESPYRAAFSGFLAQPRAWVILAFVVFFRTGESFLQKMKWPFLRDALHLSLAEYGIANGTFGVAASFAGTLLGGFLIARHGLRRWIWPFVVAQNGLHLLYVLLAAWARLGPVSLSTITAVICIEHVGEGLGTAVFTVFLMRCCDPEHRAAHMAIVTALMSIGFTVAGMASGYLAEALGFVRYFGFTFVVTIPSMALILVLPYLDGRNVNREPAR